MASFYSRLGYIINGPVIMLVVIVGLVLNIITLYILWSSKFRLSSTKKIKRTNAINFKVYEDNVVSRPLIGDNSGYTSLAHRFSDGELKSRHHKKPRIYIYMIWLTGCDLGLLLFSFLNFSLPLMKNLLSGPYALFVPVW